MFAPRRLGSGLILLLALWCLQLNSQNQTIPSTKSSSTANAPSAHGKPNCTDNGTYVNRKGQTVKRPETCPTAPAGATAQCRDGTYSFSRSRRGTCSHHGGVAKWLWN